MKLDIENIAPDSGESWKPEIGETVKGTVTHVSQSPSPSFDKSKTELTLRVDLDTLDGPVTIWATASTDIDNGGYSKRDARAIAAAVREAGCTTIETGGTLGMRRTEDIPTDMGAARGFQAQYKPPAAPSPTEAANDDGAVTDLLG